MEDNFTPELIEKARQANSPEELLALAKESGIELSEDKAKEYFEQLNRSGELSDEELDNVSGGGCYYKDGRLVVTVHYKCQRWTCKDCGAEVPDCGAEHNYHVCFVTGEKRYWDRACKNCKMKTNKGARMLCNHPLNYKR